MTRCRPSTRASQGASAPKPANASTGSVVSTPAVVLLIAEAGGDLVEHRPDAHRGGPQVERQHHDADHDEDPLGAGVGRAGAVGPAVRSPRHPPASDRPVPPVGCAPCANNPSSRPRRSSGSGPLRQARPAPVHQPPRLLPGLRARHRPGPGPDGLLLGVQPAPADLLRRRRADRRGERGGVPRDRAGPRGRPRRGARRPRRGAADGLDVLEVVESRGGSLADLLEASVWRITVPGLAAGRGRAGGRGVPRGRARCWSSG